MAYIPESIYIDDRAQDYALTRRIRTMFPRVPTHIVSQTKNFLKEFNKKSAAISLGKRSFFLTINKGRFLKKCPGTKNYLCCGYQILYPSQQCSLDCTYCILQSYFNNPLITFFVNTADLLEELARKLDQNKKRLWRIGTGEFTDSLAFETITGLGTQLIPFFQTKPNAILELKTKTADITPLLRFYPHGKVVLAWSLNARSITEMEEHGAAALEERLDAARRCALNGYKLAFHFDPLFYFSGWKAAYKETVCRLFEYIRPEHIAWISLGCFRFMPPLKAIIGERFPKSNLPYNEFIPGLDGKMRYPKPIRIAIYREMHTLIKSHNSNVFIYLCMESAEVWQKAFGYTPRRFGSLKRALDRQVFPIDPPA
jgi:spore photoproduct lyase